MQVTPFSAATILVFAIASPETTSDDPLPR